MMTHTRPLPCCMVLERIQLSVWCKQTALAVGMVVCFGWCVLVPLSVLIICRVCLCSDLAHMGLCHRCLVAGGTDVNDCVTFP